MYHLKTTTVFPREYFVPKENIEFKEQDFNIPLSMRECDIVISCINLMIDQCCHDQIQTVEILEEIRTKIEIKLINREHNTH